MSAIPPSLSPAKPTTNLFSSISLKPCLFLLELCKYTTEFRQVHAKLTKLGLVHNPLALTRLLCYSSISPHADLNYARSIFNLDKNPNTFAYNVLIRGYVQAEEAEKALSLFCGMVCNPTSVPNKLTFPFVLKACSQVEAVEEGKQVHGLVFKHGFSEDLYVQNSLISMYSSFGLTGFACQVFDRISNPDVVSWNSVIKGLVDSGLVDEGRCMFDRMSERSLVTWNCLIDGYVKVGLLNEARELFDQTEEKDSVSWNTMLAGYVGSGLMNDAQGLFNEMPLKVKDLISFNLMIDGYARETRHKQVIEIFQEMQRANIELNRFTMVNVLNACSHVAALKQGEWIHDYIERKSIEVNAFLGTALVDMLAKCGNIERALSAFESMKEKNVAAWNSIIYNLGAHGYGHKALEIFSDMLTSNVLPDEITYLGLLSACRHSGLVHQGKRYFQLMREEHGLEPRMEHYGCMVDLLCRADLLDEAMDLIETSQMKSSIPMWGAILGASCRLGNMAMGEYAAKHLMDLDPTDTSCYVVLSNMYAAAGLHEKAMYIRNCMREKGLEKEPGSSSIEIDGLVHDFRVGSNSPDVNSVFLTSLFI